MAIIHFFSLPEMAAEVPPWEVVRVQRAMREIQAKTPGLGTVVGQVHVRAIVNDDITTFMLHCGSVQTIHGKAANSQDKEKLERRLELAEGAVRRYLTNLGFAVYPGMIDIGGATPASGEWTGLVLEEDGDGTDKAEE